MIFLPSLAEQAFAKNVRDDRPRRFRAEDFRNSWVVAFARTVWLGSGLYDGRLRADLYALKGGEPKSLTIGMNIQVRRGDREDYSDERPPRHRSFVTRLGNDCPGRLRNSGPVTPQRKMT